MNVQWNHTAGSGWDWEMWREERWFAYELQSVLEHTYHEWPVCCPYLAPEILAFSGWLGDISVVLQSVFCPVVMTHLGGGAPGLLVAWIDLFRVKRIGIRIPNLASSFPSGISKQRTECGDKVCIACALYFGRCIGPVVTGELAEGSERRRKAFLILFQQVLSSVSKNETSANG